MIDKKVITITLPNALGGVASFNRNILEYFDRGRVFVRVILLSVDEVKRPIINEGFNCDELIFFTYSNYDNNYLVLDRLGKLIGDDTQSVLTDNGLTLSALALSKSQAIIHYLNHDFFYVKQALWHTKDFDYSICHSDFFNDCLASADFVSFENKLIKLPYGVQIFDDIQKFSTTNLKLVFLGRFDYPKGILTIIEIENELEKRGVFVDWLIIGDGPLKEEVLNQWKGKDNVSFQQPRTANDVFKLLKQQDILVFPSLFEGTPVAIFEAMSCGCLPVVYDIPGGVREYLKDEFSIKVKAKDIYAMIGILEKLDNDRAQLAKMQLAAHRFSKENLDQAKLNWQYFEFIFNAPSTRNKENKVLPRFGFLDNKFCPNYVSRILKRFKETVKRLIGRLL